MAFEKGKMNFSVLVSVEGVGDEFEDSVVAEAYKDAKPTLDTPVEDFSAGISLADAAAASKDRFFVGSQFYASTRKKEYKLPKSRLKEEIEMVLHEEVVRNGGERVSSKRKKELVENVKTAMQSQAQLELGGSRFALCPDRKRIIVEATSDSKLDEVLIAITAAVPMNVVKDLTAYSPEFLYELATQKNPAGYQPLTIAGRHSSEGIGRDFLTWLWAASETDGAINGLTVALTGMIQLDGEDDGTGPVTVILKDGAPAIGAEVNAVLAQGKKVSKAEFSIADGDLVYRAVIDEKFHFKGFAGPSGTDKGASAGERFDARIMDCIAFQKILERAFKEFCKDDSQLVVNAWEILRQLKK